MDGLDWINLQEEGFDDDGLMMMMDPIPKSSASSDSNPLLFQPWNVLNPSPLILDSPLQQCLLSAPSHSQTETASLDDVDDGISTFWNFTTPPPPPPPKPAVAAAVSDPLPPKRKRSETTPDFHLTTTTTTTTKRPKQDTINMSTNSKSSNISFSQQTSSSAASSGDEPDAEAIAQMKEMIYRAAAFRPVNFGAETVDKPKRKNVRISSDPQTVAARQRRERISERIRVLQKLVPGGNKMDTASMLDEAANYLKFLRSQVKALEALGHGGNGNGNGNGIANMGYSPFVNLASFAAAFQQPQFSIQQQMNPVHRSLS